MRLLQIFLLLIGIIGFTAKEDSPKAINVHKPLRVTTFKDSTIHYLALGDSYTAGTSARPGKSFPLQLVACLQKELQKEVELEVIAKAGWRTDELLNGLKSGTLQRSYNVVTLLIGVNNHYQKKPFNQYKKEFSKLVEQAINLSST